MKDFIGRIGRKAKIWKDGMGIPVYIRDVRAAYGRIDYMVSPIGGSGSLWVSEPNVEFDEGEGNHDLP